MLHLVLVQHSEVGSAPDPSKGFRNFGMLGM